MNYLKILFLLVILITSHTLKAQVDIICEDEIEKTNEIKDSVYIQEVEGKVGADKVLHAEPLYIDLIRDLGARKGEKEWNVGLGQTDNNTYDVYTALIEYEWAPIDRLGLEVEMPFSFYTPLSNSSNTPGSKLNSLKVAGQYSFYVSKKNKTSVAFGYIHEFELTSFSNYGKENIYKGNIYNPFFIAAKRWGNNFHTLLYTGPQLEHTLKNNNNRTIWQINSNVHYMISGTRNFIGIEANKELEKNKLYTVLRPQIRVGIAENLLIGIVAGVPLNKQRERLSSFLRLIYEPGHKVNRRHL